MNEFNLIFDFDSTIIKFETIEIIADIALEDNPEREKKLEEIKQLTSLAMNGEISFSKALKKRISLMNINESHIERTVEYLQNQLTESFYKNIENFNKRLENCFIVSGGFKEIILPILAPFGFISKNIYANTFILNELNEITVDNSNVLSKDSGKMLAVDNIKGKNIIIGDGYTDYELKKLGGAEIFILFTENIHRQRLTNKADFIAKNFNDVFNYIDND